MRFTKKITLEDIYDESKKISLKGTYENGEAATTHYFHNHKSEVSEYFEKNALSFVKNFLRNKFPKEDVNDEVAEEAIQYMAFNLNQNIPFPQPKEPTFKFIDLFAGIGGFRIAMQNIGGKCIFSSEWDEMAKKTYKANYGEVPFGDITKSSTKNFIPEKFEILCAGFPCQAFSVAGYRKGFSDTRGTLFFEIEQIAKYHRPKVLFLENVKNLVSHDKGKTFKVILEIIEKKLKYKVFYKVLNSLTHGGIPQNRDRIFIVAFDPTQVKNYNDFKFPKEVKLSKTIHDYIDKDKKELKYYYSNHKYYPELNNKMKSRDTIYQWRRVYVRENKSNACPTLTANMGTGGHNVPLIRDDYGIRKLTPKECLAFQGYPVDKFKIPKIADSKIYMQAGNSVTVNLVKRISKEIVKVL